MIEEGLPVKTPEQRAADDERREQEKALNPPKPLARYNPGSRTMTDVMEEAGTYADTIAAFALATCARTWACGSLTSKGQATCHPAVVIRFAMDLHIAQIWRDAGISNGSNRPCGSDMDRLVLDNLKSDDRRELELVVSETLAEWEAAGAPGLDTNAMQTALRYLQGHIWKGDLPPYPNCPAPAHPTGIFPEWTHNQEDQHCPS